MAGIRGFYYGYEEGFYKQRKEVSSECMNQQTVGNVQGILSFLKAPNMGNAVHAFGMLVAIFTNFQTCAVQQSITDIYEFCHNSFGVCTIQQFFQNLS